MARKKATKKKAPRKTKKEKSFKEEAETFTVKTIWKNQQQYGPQQGQDYFTLVLDDGSRITCYDSGVMEQIGIDLSQRVSNFDPPQEFEFDYEVRKDKIIITGLAGEAPKTKPTTTRPKSSSGFKGKANYSRNNPYQKKSYGKSEKEQFEMARMNALRTAVTFLEYQKSKTLSALEELTEQFLSYIQTGKFE
jgi:hypothetical protein